MNVASNRIFFANTSYECTPRAQNLFTFLLITSLFIQGCNFVPNLLVNEAPEVKIKRVIIVSYDGLRGDAVEAAPMPNLMAMMEDGAYTLAARTINYSVTLPAHASMLSGLCQSKHGVDWDVTTYYKGYSKGVDIFDAAHAAGLKTAMIVSKEKMRQLAEPETTDVFILGKEEAVAIMDTAIEQIPLGFDLMFIHFGMPDDRGHKYGWMSNAYLEALRQGDATLALLLSALNENGIRDSTLIIVTADHGGHDREHPGTLAEDLLIPWVAYGPGIQTGELTYPVSIMDTAPTVAYALELPIQAEWDGLPVYQAFGLPSLSIHTDEICK
jgi:predicted AlkP superfamily pyrophosphatase or phosphodiesterase